MRDVRLRRARGLALGRAVRGVALLAVALGVARQAGAQVTSRWEEDAAGNWAEGFRWTTDPAYPDNGSPAGATYDVVIDATGIAYSVNVDRDLVVQRVTLNSPNASVRQSGGTFRTVNGIDINRGSWWVSGDAALESDVRVGPGSGLVVENGSGYRGTVSLDGNASMSFGTGQTFAGPAQVILNRINEGYQANLIYGSDLTIGPDVSIWSGSGYGLIGKPTDALTNHGRVTASGGQFVRVIGNTLSNHGTLEAIDGGTLIVEPNGASSNTGTIRATSGGTVALVANGGTWTNTGGLEIADATLVLAGQTISPAMTAGLARGAGASVVVAGVVPNVGSTLALDAFGGPWALGYVDLPISSLSTSGEIRGGSLGSPGGGGTLPVVGRAQLTDVANHANIDVRPGATLTLQGGTANDGSITANDASVVVFGAPVALGAMSLTDSTLQMGTTYLPTPDTTASVTRGQLAQVGLHNSRVLVAKGATVENGGGTIRVVPGAPWHLAGGTIKNGAIDVADGGVFGTSTDGAADGAAPQNSVLDNVAVTGTLTLDNSGLTLQNGSTWTGDRIKINAGASTTTRAPAVVFGGDVTLDSAVEISFHGAAARAVVAGSAGTFALDADVTVRNETAFDQRLTLGTNSAAIVNRRKLSINGVVVTLQGNAITNDGLIEVRGAGGDLILLRAPTNYAARKLTGGRWHVYDGGTLSLTAGYVDRIDTNAAEVVVSGAASTLWNFPFRLLNRNEGSLSVLDGHVMNVGALTNVGEVKVGLRSVVTTEGKLDSTGGKFDTDGLVIVAGTEGTRIELLHDVTEQIRTARNSPAGRWKGSSGITSSAAAANPLTGLAAIINDNGSGSPIVTDSYGTVTPDVNSIIVMYTYNGDANLDGRVNADDYFRIDQGFLAQRADPTYRDGDFNYDGTVNADDYFLIDQAFLGQGEPLGGAAAMAAVAVPEPAVAGMLSLGGLLMRRRRRR